MVIHFKWMTVFLMKLLIQKIAVSMRISSKGCENATFKACMYNSKMCLDMLKNRVYSAQIR